MRNISTDRVSKPGGHYSQAVVYEDLVFVSGQLPTKPFTDCQCRGPIEEQAKQTLCNLKAVLSAAGSDLSHVLKTTVYISDIALWDSVNVVYASFFGDHRPARSVVPSRELHHGFQIEIKAIATRVEKIQSSVAISS